jgi:hypothetical protein
MPVELGISLADEDGGERHLRREREGERRTEHQVLLPVEVDQLVAVEVLHGVEDLALA